MDILDGDDDVLRVAPVRIDEPIVQRDSDHLSSVKRRQALARRIVAFSSAVRLGIERVCPTS